MRLLMAKANPLRCAVLGLAFTLGSGGLAGALNIGAVRAAAAPDRSASGSSSELHQRGVTKPCEETNLAFPGPGIVSKVNVKAGDVVKVGQVIATQDDREEKAKLAVAQVDAESIQQIEAAKADLEAKKVELHRKELLYADQIKADPKFSNSELDEARVGVKIADISVEFRKQEKHQKELEFALQQVAVEKKKLVSPIDGIVAKVDVHPGDGVDLTKPAVQLVQNDPLWVEVDIPSPRAKQLQVKQTLQVRYTDEEAWSPASIIFLTPYASAGSNTRHVRLEMPNPSHREAGLPVLVQLPDGLAEAK